MYAVWVSFNKVSGELYFRRTHPWGGTQNQCHLRMEHCILVKWNCADEKIIINIFTLGIIKISGSCRHVQYATPLVNNMTWCYMFSPRKNMLSSIEFIYTSLYPEAS